MQYGMVASGRVIFMETALPPALANGSNRAQAALAELVTRIPRAIREDGSAEPPE